MIAATPNAMVWKSDWPVAWRSAGSRVAMVRTTPTTMPANAIPVKRRVAMMIAGTSATAHVAKHAA